MTNYDSSSQHAPWSSWMPSIKTVHVNEGVTSIGKYAFESAANLSSVFLPDGLESIGVNAFCSCDSLRTIKIPSTVYSIDVFSFQSCKNMEYIEIEPSNPTYESIDGVLTNKKSHTLVYYPGGRKGPYVVPSNITVIEHDAFSCCHGLTSLTLTNVTTTRLNSFDDCDQLTSVIFGNSLTSIGVQSFWGCTRMTKIILPVSLLTIELNAFSYCSSLTSIVIPSSVTSIENNTFGYCHSLASVIYLGSKDPINESATNIFNGCDQLKFVCVSSGYNNGLSQFCKHQSCESFLLNANHCYEPVCNDNNTVSMEKRENATIWESKTTGCYKFQCHNDTGPIYLKQCNKKDEVCENDQCAKNEEVTYYVEIEVERIRPNDFKMNVIRKTLSDLTGIEEDKLRIRFETNDNNEITRIVVIVEDKETAEIIKDKINVSIDECRRM